jgi:hypothetical protein
MSSPLISKKYPDGPRHLIQTAVAQGRTSPAHNHASRPSGEYISRPLTWRVIVASPVLYGMLIPLAFLDLCLTLYHWTAFPLLRIPRIRRSAYIRLDRHRLPYLPWIVKLTCTYCGYANGLLQYAARLAGDTEAFFCPIKHQQRSQTFHPPSHHSGFAEFGDVQGAQTRYQQSPNKLKS